MPMSAVTVRPVTSSADRKRFLDFPYSHYAEDRTFVPPLRMDQAKVIDPKKNPFFEHGDMQLFIAERAGEVVGRIAGIVNGMHLQKYNDGNGFFGFYETVEAPEVSTALLDAATGWLKQRGLTGVRGPTNPSMNDVAGLLVGGFHRAPSILLPYNKPYYESYLNDYGFTRAMTMWAFYVHDAYVNAPKMERGAGLVMRRYPGLTVRQFDKSRFYEEVDAAMDIYNLAWAENWGHVPYTSHEARHLADDLKQILEEDLFLFVEDEGTPVAFSVSLPNLNRALQRIPNGRLLPTGLAKLLAWGQFGGIYEIRMALMGVHPDYRGRGIDAILINETIKNGRQRGYEAAEMSWVLDVNTPLINALEKLGAVKDKEYAMLEMTF